MTFDLSTIAVVRILHEHDVRFVFCADAQESRAGHTILYEGSEQNVRALVLAMHELGTTLDSADAPVSVAFEMLRNSRTIGVLVLGKQWSLAGSINGESYESVAAIAEPVVVAQPFRTMMITS